MTFQYLLLLLGFQAKNNPNTLYPKRDSMDLIRPYLPIAKIIALILILILCAGLCFALVPGNESGMLRNFLAGGV